MFLCKDLRPVFQKLGGNPIDLSTTLRPLRLAEYFYCISSDHESGCLYNLKIFEVIKLTNHSRQRKNQPEMQTLKLSGHQYICKH